MVNFDGQLSTVCSHLGKGLDEELSGLCCLVGMAVRDFLNWVN